MAGQTYTLIFKNNSTNAGDVCVYQTDPNINSPSVKSLAWFSEYNYPTTDVQFQWEIDYNFVWGQTGSLAARGGNRLGAALAGHLPGTWRDGGS